MLHFTVNAISLYVLQFEDYVLLRQLAKTCKTIFIQVATYVYIGCI